MYYITGAALHAALGLCEHDSEEVKVLKKGLCFLSGQEAMLSSDVPCQVTLMRQRSNLLFTQKCIYDVMQYLESEVLVPLLANNRLLACLGNMLSTYVETQVQISGVYDRMALIFAKALGWSKVDMDESAEEPNEETLADYKSDGSCSNDQSLPMRLSLKLLRYYIGASFNDFMKHKERALRHDRDFTKRVAFRTQVLTKRILSEA